MVIICEKVGSTKSIRVGGRYQVQSQTNTRYRIVNENGIEANYCKSLFREGRETGNERRLREGNNGLAPAPAVAAPAPLPPPPPPVPVITEIDVVTSCSANVDGVIGVKAVFTFNGQHSFTQEITSGLQVNNSQIGCGIRDISGLNNLLAFTRLLRSRLTENIVSQNARRVFTVSNDIDIDDIIIDVKAAFLQDIISKFQGGRGYYAAGVINFSTNITNNNSVDSELFDIFTEQASSIITFVNPNGGNTCSIWSFKTAE